MYVSTYTRMQMFGDVDKLIRTVFCKQMYLRRQKIVNITATQSQVCFKCMTTQCVCARACMRIPRVRMCRLMHRRMYKYMDA